MTNFDNITKNEDTLAKNGKPMTEQEYLQSCNTEQLAEVLFSWYKLGRLDVINKHTELKKDWLIEWLKQPHKGVANEKRCCKSKTQ